MISGPYYMSSNEPKAQSVKVFIQTIYQKSYGTTITHWPKFLMYWTKNQEIYAAIGLNDDPSTWFVNFYFSGSLLDWLKGKANETMDFTDLLNAYGAPLEISAWAAKSAGASRWLIVQLRRWLVDQGVRWVVFTGTKQLKNSFTKLQLYPIELRAATLNDLPVEEQSNWANYYKTKPVVMLGFVL